MSDLRALLDEYWERVLHDYPSMATQLGDRRFEDRLNSYSAASHAEHLIFQQDVLRRARAIDPATLSERDRMERAVFLELLDKELAGERFEAHLMPLTQLFGPHLELMQIASIHPMVDQAGVESYLRRLRAFATQVDEVIESLREGLGKGIVGAKVNMEAVLSQVEAQAHLVNGKSPLLDPLKTLGEDIAGAEAYRDQADALVRDAVTPAYAKLAEFLRQEYLPGCREVHGIHALPQGEALYDHLVRHHTTLDISADEVHRIGREEVARIHAEMESVKAGLGFQGSMAEFAAALRGRPELHCSTAEDVVDGFREVLAGISERLPELFGRLPKAPFEVRPVEEFRAANAPDAYYMPPAPGRPGVFYANTHRPETRPRYTMEALAYHEAVPGHHLQIALAQEIEDLPDFRKHGHFTAYVEGWALYSERLPKQLGFYQDPYSEFGRLTLELWRAARLVVDTGIHSKGWSRDEAIDYMSRTTALSADNVRAEVERYICMAGQALAYKIGELRITELRRRAAAALPQFDLRAFHDRLIEIGGLPLDVLDTWMNDWVEEMKR